MLFFVTIILVAIFASTSVINLVSALPASKAVSPAKAVVSSSSQNHNSSLLVKSTKPKQRRSNQQRGSQNDSGGTGRGFGFVTFGAVHSAVAGLHEQELGLVNARGGGGGGGINYDSDSVVFPHTLAFIYPCYSKYICTYL